MTPRPGRAAGARTGRRWVELDGEGALGRTDREAERARGRADADGGRGRHPPCRPRATRRRGGGVSLLRLEGVVREVGRSSSSTGSRRRSRPASGSGSSGRTAPARRRCSGSRRGATSRTAGTVRRKRGLTLGLLGQEAHFDEAFMAAPDLRSAVRHGAAHLERMAEELGRLEHDGPRRRAPTTPTSSTGSTSSAATRSTSAWTRRCRASASRATSGRGRRPRSPAASRPARPSPGWSSPTRTCCCSTSRRTTSTSGRSSGSRSTSAAAPGRLLVASHDRAFLDATVSRVWELRDRRLTVFRGDYTAYHRQRVERDARGRARGRVARRTRSRARSSSSSATGASAST